MTADIDPDEEWLNAEVSAEDTTPTAARDILKSLEHALRGAPTDGRRYDIEVTVTEHTAGDEHRLAGAEPKRQPTEDTDK